MRNSGSVLPTAATHATFVRRDIFTEEHRMFRAPVRRFADTGIESKVLGWGITLERHHRR
jgi:hypothetical protein